MDQSPKAMTNNSGSSNSTNAAANTSSTAQRRRSEHRRRRNNGKRLSSHEKEKQLRRKTDIKILMFTAPSLILIIGGILWVTATIEPDESMRHKGLISLAEKMLMAGGFFFVFALLVDWTKKFLTYTKEKRNKATTASTPVRRRSTHRRHRRHHEATPENKNPPSQPLDHDFR